MSIVAQDAANVNWPDRIDFAVLGNGQVSVIKFRHNAKQRQDVPLSHSIKDGDFCLAAALQWCKEHGYIVRSWPGGARAWKGKLRVIRTGHEIMRLRRQLEDQWSAQFQRNPGKWSALDTLLTLDLAYDG